MEENIIQRKNFMGRNLLYTKQIEWMYHNHISIDDGRYINPKRFRKLLKLVLRYNRIATKWCYDEIAIDRKYYNVIPIFFEGKSCPPGLNAWGRFKHGFKDGFLKSLFNDIDEVTNGLFLDADLYKELKKQHSKSY